MPSKSDKQRKFFATALAYKRGNISNVSDDIKNVADSMSEKELELFSKKIDREISNEKQDREIQQYYDVIDDFILDIILNTMDSTYINEAEYNGRKVQLNKIMRGDSKKFKVYVKNPKTGNIVKVDFGQKGMRIKKNDPKRRKAFRARHKCDQKTDKTKPGYWACKTW
jgi:hypothetical protein